MMEKRRALQLTLLVTAIVSGATLYSHIDFQGRAINKPALAALYFIAFLLSLIGLLSARRNNKNRNRS